MKEFFQTETTMNNYQLLFFLILSGILASFISIRIYDWYITRQFKKLAEHEKSEALKLRVSTYNEPNKLKPEDLQD